VRRLVLLLISIICSFSISVAQGSSIATATPLAANGNAGAGMDNLSPDQYWKVTTSLDGYLRFHVVSSAGLDVDVTLYDVNGTTTILSDMRTGQNSEVFAFLKPGTYYLRVTRWSGTSGSYTVTSSFASPSRSEDPEPNSAPASAVSLGPNSASTGHLCYYSAGQLDTVDYWKITTPQDGWLRVQVRSDSLDARGDMTLDLDVVLFDVNGTTQVVSDQRLSPFSQVAAFVRPGTYYIRIHRWTGRAGTYDITSELTTPPRANDTEGNDVFARAGVISLNVPGTGHIGYYSNGFTDYVDYWKITAPTGDSIYVHVTSDVSLDLDVTAYGPDTTSSIVADGRAGTYSRVGFKPVAGSTYYCKVSYWSGTAGSYSLSASPSAVPVSVEGTSTVDVLPVQYALTQNYPNPFNPSTTVRFQIPVAGQVDLRVYDLLGREVATLASGFRQPGTHSVTFDATGLTSGAYIYRFTAPGFTATRRMVLVK
jgi:hypothetical protein